MTGVFRKEYKPLSDEQTAYIEIFKEKAQELYNQFIVASFLNPDPRYMEYAGKDLENSVMWAVKSITG